MNIIESLNWRYAVKKFSPKKVSETEIDTILEAIRLSPSSAGMQPYRVVLLEDRELRKQLGADSFNAQIAESSHLLVFAARTEIKQVDIDEYIDRVASIRNQPVQQLQPFKQSLESHLLPRTADQNFAWASRQAYIALGTAVVAAAGLGVDATPMEGFNPAKFDELLGLKSQGYQSVVLLALGHRDSDNDPFAAAPKVRLSREELVVQP